jgi:hypothetical protein
MMSQVDAKHVLKLLVDYSRFLQHSGRDLLCRPSARRRRGSRVSVVW